MNTNVKKLLVILMAVCMLLGLMVGCAGGGNTPADNDATDGTAEATGGAQAGAEVTEPQYGGHLNIAMSTSMQVPDPVTRAGIWWYMFQTCMFENPLTRDAQNNIAPGVCDYEMAEDGMSITLWVRDGVLFHDGTPVEIEDVKASIERGVSEGNSVREFIGPAIDTMEIAENKLVIKWKAQNLVEGAMSRLAAYQPWVAVMPKEICQAHLNDIDITTIDALIGTGPYMATDFENGNFLTVKRFEDYVPLESDRTGHAGPKYAYMDSITFWENRDYSSVVMGMLSGQYDLTDCMETEYLEMAKEAGIIQSIYEPTQTCALWFFNNAGYDNVCAKYPPLRKAVIAAVDMQEYATLTTDNAMKITGTGPVVDPEYYTNWYNETDWYNCGSDQAVVDKYLEEARAMGYKDEPIQLCVSGDLSESMTLLTGYLDNAGIHYKVNFMESAQLSQFMLDPKNNWDLQMEMEYGSFLPSTLCEENLTFYYASEERDRLLTELTNLVAGTDEYKAKWQELHKVIVDDCSIIHFGFYDMNWLHHETLHPDYEGDQPYFFNTWWENPDEHVSPFG